MIRRDKITIKASNLQIQKTEATSEREREKKKTKSGMPPPNQRLNYLIKRCQAGFKLTIKDETKGGGANETRETDESTVENETNDIIG